MDGSLIVLEHATEVSALEKVASDYQLSIANAKTDMQRTFLVAAGMRKLREAMTPALMQDVMTLQGTDLGFRTDKDKEGGYDVETVRDCVAGAMLRGFCPVGNEFNIIAGRFYGCKAGFERLVRTFPGLTDLEIYKGNPEQTGGTAYVPVVAAWMINGAPDRVEMTKKKLKDGQDIDLRIAVRVNAGMGIDAILGKADRKVFAAIYTRITGAREIIPEGEVEEVAHAAPLDKKVKPSGLFADVPVDDSPNNEVSGDALEAYDRRIMALDSRAGGQQIAKEVGADKRLTIEDRKTAMGWLNDRLKELGTKR